MSDGPCRPPFYVSVVGGREPPRPSEFEAIGAHAFPVGVTATRASRHSAPPEVRGRNARNPPGAGALILRFGASGPGSRGAGALNLGRTDVPIVVGGGA